MFIRSTVFGASLLIAAGSALAHKDENHVAHDGSGYVGSGGNVITTGLDSCLRTGVWSPDNQINACEGIEDVVEEEVVEEVVAEAPKEPESRTETIVSNQNANFDTDSDVLTQSGEDIILSVVDEIASLDTIGSLTVIGHTDSSGSEAYNQDLSERRAQSVADLLSSRLPNADMRVVGLGESSPIAPNDTSEGRSQNRRVEVVFDGTRVIFN